MLRWTFAFLVFDVNEVRPQKSYLSLETIDLILVFIGERSDAICHHLRGHTIGYHLIIREVCVLGGLLGLYLERRLILLNHVAILLL